MYTVDVINQNQHPPLHLRYGDIISLGKKHQRQHDANLWSSHSEISAATTIAPITSCAPP